MCQLIPLLYLMSVCVDVACVLTVPLCVLLWHSGVVGVGSLESATLSPDGVSALPSPEK